MPNASDLSESLEVLTESTSEDTYGETTSTYSVGRTERAEVQVRGGSERRVGGRPEEEAPILIRMRKRAADREAKITRGSRLRWRGDDLQVHARREMGKRDLWVELEATRTRD